MTAATHAFPDPLIPATIPSGVGAGMKTAKILVNALSGVFHCSECRFVGETYASVRTHRRHAHGKGAGRGTKSAPTTSQDRLSGALLLILAVRDDLAGDAAEPATVPAEWKSRAIAAEKALRSLRRILGTDAEVTQ